MPDTGPSCGHFVLAACISKTPRWWFKKYPDALTGLTLYDELSKKYRITLRRFTKRRPTVAQYAPHVRRVSVLVTKTHVMVACTRKVWDCNVTCWTDPKSHEMSDYRVIQSWHLRLRD